MEGMKMPNGRYQFCHGVVATSGFLTFVVALHQVRLSNLYVEGFVLLVLFIVDYFHLDGFAEEEEEEDQGRNREEKGKRAERVKERKGQVGNGKSKRKYSQAASRLPTKV